MKQDTLLLTVRAEAVVANLLRLKKNVVATPSRLISLDEVKTLLTHMSDEMRAARKAMIEIETSAPPDLVQVMNEKLMSVTKQLGDATEKIKTLRNTCFYVQHDTPVASELNDGIGKTDGLRVEVENVKPKVLAPAPDFTYLWTLVRDKAAETTRPLVEDYVELMGGVALRDSGFDEGISEIADELLRAYVATGTKPTFIALPMRQQALLKTFAQIVRVTFPDWTMWSLPFTALEFWNAIASRAIRAPLDAQVEALPASEEDKITAADYDCLGDGYAVFTMGPAYAYCALTLMLDPMSEDHHRRVRGILAMLESMDRKEGAAPPYKATRKQLLKAWNAARKQLGRAELMLDVDDPDAADVSDPEGVGTRLLMQNFAGVLSLLTSPGFVVEIWNDIQPWIEPLLTRNVQAIKNKIPNGAELRHVLNAAWIARTHPDRDPNIDLTDAVNELRTLVRGKGK
jgi:hypothetical protein